MLFRFSCIFYFFAFCTISHADTDRVCRDFSAKIPNLTTALCQQAKLEDMRARSVLGRTIWGRDVSSEDAKLRILVLGAMHGDEMSSSALVFQWIAFAQIPPADMPQSIHWRFIPALNPDGIFARRPHRVNANGIDLNRNFPTPNWARDARFYWEKRTRRDPRRWPGTNPLSEPESQFVHAQINSFKPNLIVSVHAPYALLDFDGPSVPPDRLGRLYLDQVGIFPGSLGNYGGVHRGVPVVTIELTSALHAPREAEARQMWLDLLRWTAERLGGSKSLARAGG